MEMSLLEHEVALANALGRVRSVRAIARDLITAAARYMGARCASDAATSGRPDTELFHELLVECGTPLNRAFSGRVGCDPTAVARVFAGLGTLRENLCHLYRFLNAVLGPDAVGPHAREDFAALAMAAGWDMVRMLAIVADAEHAGGCTRAELDPISGFIKVPWSPIREWQTTMRRERCPGATDYDGGWSQVTRERFVTTLGGELSPHEREHISPRGAEFVPWQDAGELYLLNEDEPRVAAALRAGVPLVTGVSGVTMQLFIFGLAMLGTARGRSPRDAAALRAACVSALVCTGCHTVTEVAVAAALSAGEAELALVHAYAELVEPLSDANDELFALALARALPCCADSVWRS